MNRFQSNDPTQSPEQAAEAKRLELVEIQARFNGTRPSALRDSIPCIFRVLTFLKGGAPSVIGATCFVNNTWREAVLFFKPADLLIRLKRQDTFFYRQALFNLARHGCADLLDLLLRGGDVTLVPSVAEQRELIVSTGKKESGLVWMSLFELLNGCVSTTMALGNSAQVADIIDYLMSRWSEDVSRKGRKPSEPICHVTASSSASIFGRVVVCLSVVAAAAAVRGMRAALRAILHHFIHLPAECFNVERGERLHDMLSIVAADAAAAAVSVTSSSRKVSLLRSPLHSCASLLLKKEFQVCLESGAFGKTLQEQKAVLNSSCPHPENKPVLWLALFAPTPPLSYTEMQQEVQIKAEFEQRKLDFIRFLLVDLGVDVNAFAVQDRRSLLATAATTRSFLGMMSYDLVKLLIQHGGDVTERVEMEEDVDDYPMKSKRRFGLAATIAITARNDNSATSAAVPFLRAVVEDGRVDLLETVHMVNSLSFTDTCDVFRLVVDEYGARCSSAIAAVAAAAAAATSSSIEETGYQDAELSSIVNAIFAQQRERNVRGQERVEWLTKPVYCTRVGHGAVKTASRVESVRRVGWGSLAQAMQSFVDQQLQQH